MKKKMMKKKMMKKKININFQKVTILIAIFKKATILCGAKLSI